MNVPQEISDALIAGECIVCDTKPVASVAAYLPHRQPEARRRALFYALCADCMAEVQKPATRADALAAIERLIAQKLGGLV
jgi:hypothetical protein